MRHRAVGVEAGDGREAQRNKIRPTRTRGRQPFVHGELGDRFATLRAFEPREKFGERRAVLLHRRAHVLGVRLGLARFQEGGRIDRLDDVHRRRHRLQQPIRDPARIDQQARAAGQARERCGGLAIRFDMDTVARQRFGQRSRHLAVGHEQRDAIQPDQCMRDEHRVVADVGAAQVKQPGEIVKRRNEVPLRALVLHRTADLVEFLGTGHGGMRRGMLEHLLGRQRRPLQPDGVEQIDVGAQFHAVRAQRMSQRTRSGKPQHRTVDADGGASRQVLRHPVEVRLRLLAAEHLHQLDAGAGQLRFGLLPVTAVGPQAGKAVSHNQRAGGAGETR